MANRALSGELDRILRALTITGTGAGCAVIDRRGTIKGVNTELADLLHTSQEDLIDTPIWAHDMEMTAGQFEIYRDHLRPGELHIRETVIERRDISQFPARISSARVTVGEVEVLLWFIANDYPTHGPPRKEFRHLVSLLPRTTNQGSMLSRN